MGANGITNPCDLVPTNKRLKELESEFLQSNACICEGLKWVGFHMPVTHMDFGKTIACICARESEITSKKDLLVQLSNLNEKKYFKDYNVSINPNCEKGYLASLEWSRGEGTSMLVLYGQTGVGKTHLAIASGWTSMELGNPVLFYSASELIRKLQSKVQDGGLNRLIDEIKSSQNLIIDDLGREYTTGWTTSVFHEIIDYRYNNQNHLRTLITTNHSLEELEKIVGTPIVSRLTDHVVSTLIVMDGKDVRGSKR